MILSDSKNFVCIGGPYNIFIEDEKGWYRALQNQLRAGKIDFIEKVTKGGIEIWRSRDGYKDKFDNREERLETYKSQRGSAKLGTSHAYRF